MALHEFYQQQYIEITFKVTFQITAFIWMVEAGTQSYANR